MLSNNKPRSPPFKLTKLSKKQQTKILIINEIKWIIMKFVLIPNIFFIPVVKKKTGKK